MIQELRMIAIVVSATLAALFVHHALDQAKATAASGLVAPLTAPQDQLPVFAG